MFNESRNKGKMMTGKGKKPGFIVMIALSPSLKKKKASGKKK